MKAFRQLVEEVVRLDSGESVELDQLIMPDGSIRYRLDTYGPIVLGTRDAGILAGSLLDRFFSPLAEADTSELAAPIFRPGAMARADMPQIPSDRAEDFVTFLTVRGVRVSSREIRADGLLPCQADFDPSKIRGIVDGSLPRETLFLPVIVSGEGRGQKPFILDGHHRWAALFQLDSGMPVRVLQARCPIATLFDLARDFGGATYKELGESALSLAGGGRFWIDPGTGEVHDVESTHAETAMDIRPHPRGSIHAAEDLIQRGWLRGIPTGRGLQVETRTWNNRAKDVLYDYLRTRRDIYTVVTVFSGREEVFRGTIEDVLKGFFPD